MISWPPPMVSVSPIRAMTMPRSLTRTLPNPRPRSMDGISPLLFPQLGLEGRNTRTAATFRRALRKMRTHPWVTDAKRAARARQAALKKDQKALGLLARHLAGQDQLQLLAHVGGQFLDAPAVIGGVTEVGDEGVPDHARQQGLVDVLTQFALAHGRLKQILDPQHERPDQRARPLIGVFRLEPGARDH